MSLRAFPPLSFGNVAARAPAAGGGFSSEAQQFITRSSGLSGGDQTLYAALIDGLVTDGIWSKLDLLYILCAPDTTNALINLKSSSFGATTTSLTFTAYTGYAGVDDGSTASSLNPGFDATTGGQQFATNSAHCMWWSNTNLQSLTIGSAINGATSGANANFCLPWYTDGNGYFAVNNGSFGDVLATGFHSGCWVASRTGASLFEVRRNGSSFFTPNSASGTIQSGTWTLLEKNRNTFSAFSLGAGLSNTEADNLRTRVGTFRTAVGL